MGLGKFVTVVALAAPALAQPCANCHRTIHQEWAQSRHAKMLQPATEQSVEGDFNGRTVVLRGSSFALRHRNGGYFVNDRRVDYTLGGRRIQQYLSKLPDGRLTVLAPTWDNAGKNWVHDFDVGNPEEVGDKEQVWNKSCYSCHVTGGRKNFDVERLRYDTQWTESGIGCEACHGPGAEHAAKPSVPMVNPARLDSSVSVMICAQCHSSRDVYVDGFKPGANYYDYFLPILQYRLPPSDDPPYWPDGRPRWVSNEAAALGESPCLLKGGASCVSCHSAAHDLRATGDGSCAKCHAAITAKVSAHTHHPADSQGSSCVECHMPKTVIGIAARIRDHSMSIPAPENTTRYGIPNACNLCHEDKDASWAAPQMDAWYGNKSRQKMIRRAEAFSGGQKGDPSAIPALLEALADVGAGPIIRANAAGYLGNFPNDPAAYDAVLHAFSDREPLVRATAVVAIRPRAAQKEAVAPAMVSLLRDEVATVRMNAAVALVAMGVPKFPGEDGERFERAKALYRARAEMYTDDAQQQFAAGKFSLFSGDMDGAISAFRTALKLDPTLPAQYYLGAALARKGDFAAARAILNLIPRNDRQYDPAQRLLADLDARSATADSAKLFLDAQVQFQNERYGLALKELEQALAQAPHAEGARQAEISRAICLEKLGRTKEAEGALEALSADAPARSNVELQLAFIELLYDTGRPEAALKRAEAALAAAPDSPEAHLWRARVLLQLNRVDEAARDAEDAVRLRPESPAAHNLLIRIYQKQGRTKDAVQEAQWLRDYQRRIESR